MTTTMRLPQLTRIPNGIVIAFLVLSFIGFIDAGFLTIEHFRGSVPPCNIASGCEAVTTSAYSQIFGIPVALGGAIYYLAVFILSLAYLDRRNPRLFNIAALLTIFGFLFSAWFVFVQLVLLKAICEWCMYSALTSTTLFILSSYLWVQNRSDRAIV